eukprot:scaffold7326_cov249-Pinguiococcus_pyrenoidosus.AAC.1
MDAVLLDRSEATSSRRLANSSSISEILSLLSPSPAGAGTLALWRSPVGAGNGDGSNAYGALGASLGL